MLPRDQDPIVAVATAPGRGAVGIVRVSGRGLQALAQALCGQPLKPRHATYTPFLDAAGQPIDQGLALFFAAPNSYTGEDVLELQAHGGPVVLQMLVQRCLEVAPPLLAGLRLAEPGEFTRRAFLNDKLDLAQAEAVADLIDAGTQAAARSAARSLQGEFSARIDELAQRLLHLRMLVEATLDFPEEEIDFLQKADAQGQLSGIEAALNAVLAQTRQGVLLREGLRVVIAGQPNVGKSSLLNALAGQEVAIVTPVAGTTRDRIEQALQIDGVPLHVVDTAGLREAHEATDEVERIGIQRSWEAIRSADAVLFVRDLSRQGQVVYEHADAAILAKWREHGVDEARILVVFNKADAPAAGPAQGVTPVGAAAQAAAPAPASTGPLHVSAKSGQGLPELKSALLARAGWQALPDGVAIARTRHLQALQRCAQHLGQAQSQLAGPQTAVPQLAGASPALDLLAEELRLAHQALGDITGHLSADELLGVIFSSFCIGK
jgi:tRNA modification GTPase